MLPKGTTIFILDGFRSAYNVGAVFRTAEAVFPSAVFPCGISALPGGRKVGHTSRGTHATVPWRWFPTAFEASSWAVVAGFGLFVVENTPDAVPLHRAGFSVSSALVFGNEAEGVSRSVWDLSPGVLVIPQAGERKCVNVASSAAMVGWEILRRRLSGCNPGS
ncbi:MAG: TrmH family RNA methyltransferase [Candidatus Fermentibacteraceae bacterium]